MRAKISPACKPLSIPADLDIAGAVEAHALLVSAMDESDASGGVTVLDLHEGTATPLALQLLVSAAGNFPSDRFRLGPRAAAALKIFEMPKRN